jgi:very-short-patch-repair endonuclease
MDTETFSCLSRAPGASQADGQNHGEDRQQSQAALQLEDKGLELVKFNNNNVPINVAVSLAFVEGDIEW